MTKQLTVLIAASLATLLTLFELAQSARADIFQWEYISPTGFNLGKQPSTLLCPGGAGVNAAPGADLSNRNLTMAYLIGADLTGATASLTNLTNAELTGANLTNAHLIGADLSYATAIVANLTNADLTQANLTNANFTAYTDENGGVYYTDLTGANLSRANLTNANFNQTTLTNVNLSQANLTNAHFFDAVFTGTNLTGAEVRSANFTRYNSDFGITAAQLYSTASYQAHDLTGIILAGNSLAGVNLAGQNLTDAKLHTNDLGFILTNLTGANLSQSNLMNADLYYVTLTGANLTGAEVRGASFFNITAAQLYSTASYQAHDLSGLKLSGNYAGLNLAGQNLASADFHRANLANANLSQANLTSADFTVHIDGYRTSPGSVLTGANLSGANITNADFSGYSYSFPTEDGVVIVDVYGADLTGVNLSGADARGANFYLSGPGSGANTRNFIQSNGHIAGLDLTAGASLVVRNYHGAAAPKIVVDQHLAMDASGTLKLVFDANHWDSLISFAPVIPVARGGTLELTFAPDVTLAGQLGRTFDLFDWTGVNPTGAFAVSSAYKWDLSKLYTTGEVTLVNLLLPGDLNDDGIVSVADVSSLMTALANLSGYEASHGLIDSEFRKIGDVNDDGRVNNADIQSLITLLANKAVSAAASGGESITAIPEPSAIALAALGFAAMFWIARNKQAQGLRALLPRWSLGLNTALADWES